MSGKVVGDVELDVRAHRAGAALPAAAQSTTAFAGAGEPARLPVTALITAPAWTAFGIDRLAPAGRESRNQERAKQTGRGDHAQP